MFKIGNRVIITGVDTDTVRYYRGIVIPFNKEDSVKDSSIDHGIFRVKYTDTNTNGESDLYIKQYLELDVQYYREQRFKKLLDR